MRPLAHSSLQKFLVISFILALVIFTIPWLVRGGDISMAAGVTLSEVGSVLWIGMVVFGFFRLRKRALWLLLGLPFAFFWVVLGIVIAYHCGHDPKACIS